LTLLDFDDLQNYIGLDNPKAAQRITQRILEAVKMLQRHPLLGPSLNRLNLRAFVVTGTPYLIAYRATDEAVYIARIWHTSRDLNSVRP
jgi:toxin ParE1/3/4